MGALIFWMLFGLLPFVLTVGAAVQGHRMRNRLPHDLRDTGVDGLPGEASVRDGELGRATGSQVFRNMPY
jgi:hypothetical protein